MSKPFLLVPLLALATVLLPGSARPGTTATALTGTVGPGFTITLKDANGKGISRLDPGDYEITVTDNSDLHNLHLSGPGVDKFTNLDNTIAGQPEKFVWDVTLTDGDYKYRCDAHPSLKGSFRAGAPLPPVPKLNGRVGPGKTISLKKGGAAVRTLTVGTYNVVVRDSTKKDNFHLSGPGVNKRTGVGGRPTVTWRLSFRVGKYSYRSDARRKLRRTFKVIPAPPQPTP